MADRFVTAASSQVGSDPSLASPKGTSKEVNYHRARIAIRMVENGPALVPRADEGPFARADAVSRLRAVECQDEGHAGSRQAPDRRVIVVGRGTQVRRRDPASDPRKRTVKVGSSDGRRKRVRYQGCGRGPQGSLGCVIVPRVRALKGLDIVH